MAKDVEEKEGQSLDQMIFNDPIDFFGIGEVKETPEKKEKVETSEEEEEQKEGEEGESFFEVEEEEQEEEGEKRVPKKVIVPKEEDEDKDFYKNLALDLKDKNILSMDLEDDEEIDAEKFLELQEKEIDLRVEETFENFFEEMDEDGKAFLKFKKDGGNTKDFFSTYNSLSNVPTIDKNDPKSSDKFLRYYYKEYEGLDEEDIDDKIEWLEDSEGRKEKYIEKYQVSVNKDEDIRKQNLLISNARITEDRKKEAEAFKTELSEVLEEIEQVGAFTFDKNEKKDLEKFIISPTVKIGKNQFITGFQSSLQAAIKDKKKLAVLAKLLKSDFDVSGIAKKVKTEVSKEVKNKIRTRSKGVKIVNSGGSGGKSLGDFF